MRQYAFPIHGLSAVDSIICFLTVSLVYAVGSRFSTSCQVKQFVNFLSTSSRSDLLWETSHTVAKIVKSRQVAEESVAKNSWISVLAFPGANSLKTYYPLFKVDYDLNSQRFLFLFYLFIYFVRYPAHLRQIYWLKNHNKSTD